MISRTAQIKLALVDDHNLFRKGLIKLISMADTENKYKIIFEAENGLDLKEKLKQKELPDIILMDIDMPDMDGFEAVDWLRKFHPSINILVISMLETEEAVVRMLRLGVKGFLSKDIEVEDINAALNAISQKGIYYSDFASGIMTSTLQQSDADKTVNKHAWNNMSENEREFLKLACSDSTYQQIADQMCLSPKTIDGYRESLFNKFKVKNRIGLVLFALKNNLVRIDSVNT